MRLTLRTRMTVLAACGLMLILVVGVAVGGNFLQARAAAQEVAQDLQPAADATEDLVVSLADMSRGIRGYVITKKTLSLRPYVEGLAGSQREIDSLNALLPRHEPALVPQLNDVVAARANWIKDVAGPVVQRVHAGHQQEAVDLISSAADTRSYDLMAAATDRLQNSIDARREAEYQRLESFSQRLAIALLIALLALLIGLVASLVLMRPWILTPLDRLRDQLRTVAGGQNREQPIQPSGPPEIFDTGRDAEAMRRQLVSEADDSRMAREGLAQDAPVAKAIRDELTRPQVADTDGLEVFGYQRPAEGVLAGDWWDSFPLPDGRAAVVLTDVSGHGAEAGIAGLRLKTTIGNSLASGSSLEQAMSLGAGLFTDAPARFATCVGVIIDRSRNTISWCNAGHLSPLLVTSDGTEINLESTGPLLSWIGGPWKSRSRAMKPGDIVLLWTDGLTESRNQPGDQLEEQGLRALLHQIGDLREHSAAELVTHVLADARNRAIDWDRDDVTLVAIRFSPKN